MFLLWIIIITYFLLIGNYNAINIINYIVLIIFCIFSAMILFLNYLEKK